MTRLIEVRTKEKARADQALADMRRLLHIAQKQVEKAKAAAGAAAAAAGTLQDEYRKTQAELFGAVMRADRDRLAAALEDNLRAQRVANFEVVRTADEQIEAEQSEADRVAAADASAAAAASATKAYDQAGQQEELFASWRSALDAPETAAAVKDAVDAKKADPYKAAVARLTRVLGGAAMVEVYRQRALFAADDAAQPARRALDAIKAAALARSDSEPLESTRLAAAAELAEAIDAAQDAAESTVPRVISARRVWAEVAGRGAVGEDREPLKTILARVATLAKTAGDAGVPAKELAYFKATRTAQSAEVALRATELVEIAKDPDTDAETDVDLTAERDALATAKTAATDALTAYIAAKAPLDDYEVAVPPDLLLDVIAVLDAELAVNRVAAVVIVDVKNALADAESAYAAAEEAETKELRAVAMVDSQVDARRRRQAASVGVAAAHRLVTMRGDR